MQQRIVAFEQLVAEEQLEAALEQLVVLEAALEQLAVVQAALVHLAVVQAALVQAALAALEQ